MGAEAEAHPLPRWSAHLLTDAIAPASASALVGRAHAEGFGEDAPTATMIAVASLLDPAWKIELEVEAVVDRR